SWEYADHLVRADAAVGHLLASLERKCSVTVMLTSDHGVAPLAEHSVSLGHIPRVRRLVELRMVEMVDAQLDQAYGEFDWFAAQLSPFVYFNDVARARPDFADVKTRAQHFYSELDGVDRVYTNDQAL